MEMWILNLRMYSFVYWFCCVVLLLISENSFTFVYGKKIPKKALSWYLLFLIPKSYFLAAFFKDNIYLSLRMS